MQLYFIRHAQSANNALWSQTGSSEGRSADPELTEIGRQQAQRLADFIASGDPSGGLGCQPQAQKGFNLTHLYCSLMVRAVATGHAVAQKLDIPLRAWMDIHEEGGIYLEDPEMGEPAGMAGYDRAYFESHYPELILPASIGEAGWWNFRPFEKQSDRLPRARKFLSDLLERHGDSDDRVALISHGGFYNLFMTVLLDLPERDHVWFRMNNAALARVDFHRKVYEVMYQNRMDYLPADLVT